MSSACISVATLATKRAEKCGHFVGHNFTQNVIVVLLQRREENGLGPRSKPSHLWWCRRCAEYEQSRVVLCEEFQHK